MEEEKDQLSEEEESVEEEKTEEETTTEEISEEESREPETKPESTVNEALDLVRALQKGYTLTRQEMSTIKQNQEAILDKLNKKEELGDEEEPLTVKKFLQLQKEQEETKVRESQKIDELIGSQLDELRARGTIKNQEDEDELLKYAVKYKIKDLFQAANQWTELQEAKRGSKSETEKAKAKSQVKQEEGSKIGTSQKTKTEKEQVINYEDIAGKDIDELIER